MEEIMFKIAVKALIVISLMAIASTLHGALTRSVAALARTLPPVSRASQGLMENASSRADCQSPIEAALGVQGVQDGRIKFHAQRVEDLIGGVWRAQVGALDQLVDYIDLIPADIRSMVLFEKLISGKDCFEIAEVLGRQDLLDVLNSCLTRLFESLPDERKNEVYAGCPGYSALCIAEGEDVSQLYGVGCSMLQLAAINGDTAAVRLLLADPRVMPDNLNHLDKNGSTPLHYAAEYGKSEVVKVLLADVRVNFHAQDRYGRTPLYVAGSKNKLDVVRVILADHRFEVNAADGAGLTLLHCAAIYSLVEVLKLVLADPRLRNETLAAQDTIGQRTPLDYAHNPKIRKLLEAAMRDRLGYVVDAE